MTDPEEKAARVSDSSTLPPSHAIRNALIHQMSVGSNQRGRSGLQEPSMPSTPSRLSQVSQAGGHASPQPGSSLAVTPSITPRPSGGVALSIGGSRGRDASTIDEREEEEEAGTSGGGGGGGRPSSQPTSPPSSAGPGGPPGRRPRGGAPPPTLSQMQKQNLSLMRQESKRKLVSAFRSLRKLSFRNFSAKKHPATNSVLDSMGSGLDGQHSSPQHSGPGSLGVGLETATDSGYSAYAAGRRNGAAGGARGTPQPAPSPTWSLRGASLRNLGARLISFQGKSPNASLIDPGEDRRRRLEKELLTRAERRRKKEEAAMMIDPRAPSAILMLRHIPSGHDLGGSGSQNAKAHAENATVSHHEPPRRPYAPRGFVYRFFNPVNGMIDPKSAFARIWTATVLLCTMLILFVAPLEAVFSKAGYDMHLSDERRGGAKNPLRIIEIIIEIVFVLDIGVQLNQGYVKDGHIIQDRGLTAFHYVRTKLFWDFTAAFPILVEIPHIVLGKPWIRLLHVFKMVSVWSDTLYAVRLVADKFGAALTIMSFLIAMFMFFVNLIAVFWFLLMRVQNCPDGEHGLLCSWLLKSNTDLEEDIVNWVASPAPDLIVGLRLYMACLYWATGASNTFLATTSVERIGAIFSHVTVYLVFGSFIIANTITAMTDFQNAWTRMFSYHKKIDIINAYMRRQNFPPELQSLVRKFYREVWLRKQTDLSDRVLLEELPGPVRKRVLCHMARQLLETSDFFQDYLNVEVEDDDELQARGAPDPSVRAATFSGATGGAAEGGGAGGATSLVQASGSSITMSLPGQPLTAQQRGRRQLSAMRQTAHTKNSSLWNMVTLSDTLDSGGQGSSGKKGAGGAAATGGIQRKDSLHFKLDPPITAAEKDKWTEGIASKMFPVAVAPGELIVKQGDATDLSMYVIKSGKVAIEQGRRVVDYQTSGSYFGEGVLLLYDKRFASVRAVTYCELFKLTKDDMKEVWLHFPRLKQVMLQTAYVRYTKHKKSNTKIVPPSLYSGVFNDTTSSPSGGAGGATSDNGSSPPSSNPGGRSEPTYNMPSFSFGMQKRPPAPPGFFGGSGEGLSSHMEGKEGEEEDYEPGPESLSKLGTWDEDYDEQPASALNVTRGAAPKPWRPDASASGDSEENSPAAPRAGTGPGAAQRPGGLGGRGLHAGIDLGLSMDEEEAGPSGGQGGL